MLIRIIIDLLIAVGLVFACAGTIGILKMPDPFSRMQAATCISTLGMLGVAVGGVLYAAVVMHSASAAIKIAVIALMIVLTNPIGSHVLARGAYTAARRENTEMLLNVDDYGRDFHE